MDMAPAALETPRGLRLLQLGPWRSTLLPYAPSPPPARQVLPLDGFWSGEASEGEGRAAARRLSNPGLPVSPASLAYILFTSGSTGRPKGVMIHQLGLADYLRWVALGSWKERCWPRISIMRAGSSVPLGLCMQKGHSEPGTLGVRSAKAQPCMNKQQAALLRAARCRGLADDFKLSPADRGMLSVTCGFDASIYQAGAMWPKGNDCCCCCCCSAMLRRRRANH